MMKACFLIDQHVAHERVLLISIAGWRQNAGLSLNKLLVPETFDLTPAQAAVFDQLVLELEVYGF
jgi:DNA mismatch repair ATPase MutL